MTKDAGLQDNAVFRETRAFGSAIRFLTRLPAPFPSSSDSWKDDLSRSPRYFPLVGAAVAAITGAIYWALAQALPLYLAAVIALAAEALLTGAFHEDALADFADAFGGGTTPERTREILKDSRVGSYGVVALAFALLTRVIALATLPPVLAIAALVMAGTLGKFFVVIVMTLVSPAPAREGLAKDVGSRASALGLIVAALTTAAIASAVWFTTPSLMPVPIAAAIAVAALTAFVVSFQMKRKLGGTVGDGLGTIAMIGQTAALAAFCVRL